MKLQEILTPDCIKCLATVSSKKRILELICALASNKIPGIDQHVLLDSLMEREKMSSTGIGHGIAIPHGRLPNAQQVIAVLITTEKAIVFDAIDNQAVDIFIALFVFCHSTIRVTKIYVKDKKKTFAKYMYILFNKKK